MIRAEIDNVWRHWWAGHMRAVGAETRLPLAPIDPAIFSRPKAKAEPRPRNTSLRKTRSRIFNAANKIIAEVLEKPRPSGRADLRGHRNDGLKPPPLSVFKNLEPVGWDGLLDDEDRWLFHPDDCGPDLVWPLNVGWISQNDKHGRLSLAKFSTVQPKQVRGLVHRFSKYMVRNDIAQLDLDDGMLHTATGISAWSGGEWIDADKRIFWTGRDSDHAMHEAEYVAPKTDRNQPAFATSFALRQRYEWAVAIGPEGLPSVRFMTDPTGIKDIFRIRDLPEGRDRRAALLAWITDHWRQNRFDPEIEGYVRKHLRGAVRFVWRGLVGEIIPSQFDVEQRDKFILERQAMRAAGTDRRKRAAA
jgi:hypothetical protein